MGIVTIPARIIGWLWGVVRWIVGWGWRRTLWFGKLVYLIAAVALVLHMVGAFAEVIE